MVAHDLDDRSPQALTPLADQRGQRVAVPGHLPEARRPRGLAGAQPPPEARPARGALRSLHDDARQRRVGRVAVQHVVWGAEVLVHGPPPRRGSVALPEVQLGQGAVRDGHGPVVGATREEGELDEEVEVARPDAAGDPQSQVHGLDLADDAAHVADDSCVGRRKDDPNRAGEFDAPLVRHAHGQVPGVDVEAQQVQRRHHAEVELVHVQVPAETPHELDDGCDALGVPDLADIDAEVVHVRDETIR